MSAIDVGRVCIITAGRRKGEEVTITKIINDNLVEVKDSKGRLRRYSIKHLHPTERKA